MKEWGRVVVATIGRAIMRRLVVREFREFLIGPEIGRALVAYLALPVFLPARLRNRVKFSNRGIAQEIVRALNELGYVVDIINFDNTSWVPKRRYELFVGHAGINFAELGRRLPDAGRIYFSTGMYWREANERLATRLQWLALRRGVLLPAHRSASAAEEDAIRSADGIVCIGNDAVAKSYSAFEGVIALNNGVYPVTWRGWQDKDFDGGRRHFLFFAGPGNVLKGLDLLLEAFRGTDLHLHVCQHLEPEFRSTYGRECEEEPNIHVYGHIRMRSRKFKELVKRCNWVITATCTEGQPGAVLECMGYGLIPIMPDTANIDSEEEWAIRINRCEVEAIREVAMAASRIGVNECRRMSQLATKVVQRRHTPDAFRRGFKEAIEAVIGASKTKQSRGRVG